MNPLASTSQVDQSQYPPIAKVSADAFDIYDSYTPLSVASILLIRDWQPSHQ